MYAKLFASLYQGTLRGQPHEILVFTNLMAHADKEGHVDKHFRAIADEVGLSVDQVKAALVTLESPDEESRSREEGGRRLLRTHPDRSWGWMIVNYSKYRAIRSEEDRREQNRLAQERWRNKHKVSKVSRDKPESAYAEGEVEGKADAEGQEEADFRDSLFEKPNEKPETPKPTWEPTPHQAEVAGWFNRRPTTIWNHREIRAWREATRDFDFESEDWQALQWFYTKSGCKFLRRDLQTLLNNWNGEIDRAKNYDPNEK